MTGPTLALAASVGLLLSPAFAQAVPKVFPQGEIVVGLDFIGFTAADILSATPLADAYGHGVLVELSPDLDAPLAAITADKTGHWLDLFLCGKRLFHARLAEDLVQASFRITADDAESAETLADAFRHPDCATPVS